MRRRGWVNRRRVRGRGSGRLLRALGRLRRAMLWSLEPGAAAVGAAGPLVWAGGGGGAPRPPGRAEGCGEEAGLDGGPVGAQQTEAAPAFQSSSHRPDGWTQPP